MTMLRAVALVGAVTVVAVGCGSPGRNDITAVATAPESVTAPSSDVASGLSRIRVIAAEVAANAASDKAAAVASSGRVEPIWKAVEGTVKANDPAAYIALEDAFSALATGAAKGDVVRASDGAGRVAATVAAYLAAHPG